MDTPMLLGIAARLREERARLGLTQAQASEAGGVKPRAQIYYERGERAPDAIYLAGLAGLGVDVLYVLCGRRAADRPLCAGPEDDVLRLYRGLPPDQQAALRVILAGLSSAST